MAAVNPNRGGKFASAQVALRKAAQELAVRQDPPPPAVTGEGAPAAPAPPPAHPPSPGPVRRRARQARLFELDEMYVGRPSLGSVFAYRDKAGQIVADVEVLHLHEESKVEAVLDGDASDHIDERWVVLDDGEPLFYVERYRPVEHPSYGVFDPDGINLGTYVSEGGLVHRGVTVREAATAPAATIRVHRHRHVLAEPDGRELGCCWRAFSAVGNDDEDEVWGLQIENQPALLDRRVLVAAPLVCHLTAFSKRHFDAGGEIALVLVVVAPPVGLALAAVERALDGLYWLRRRLE